MRSMIAGALVFTASLAFLPAMAQTTAPNAQQEKMRACNTQAGSQKLTGDARKQFMSQCLSGKPAAGKPLTSQQQKMKDCNVSASKSKLTGDQRKQFMSNCLKGS